MSNEVVHAGNALPEIVGPAVIAQRVGLVQEIMKGIMQEGTHYGKIPGCGDKPSLLQPGAQVLCVGFQLYADPVTEEIRQLDGGHIEIRTKVAIRKLSDDRTVSFGVGICSTMEGRYRYRNAEPKVEPTDEAIPPDARENKAKYAAMGFGMRKIDGVWRWCRIEKTDGKVEHDNPADYYNTVRKIAFKRAVVHGTINATACSDIFTQDVEDMQEVFSRSSAFSAGPAPYEAAERAQGEAPAKPEQKPSEGEKARPASNAEGFGQVPAMPKAVFDQIVLAFAKVSPNLDEKWLRRLVPAPVVEDRDRLLVVFRAIREGRLDIDTAVKQTDMATIQDLIR